ncbi:MAG: bifunctional folylpolyglutamate synthase/dihydrofolate synthase [Acidipila sp.]|nr:bifunctional folylpolyglutamate synthase/dihydrofolate synthase [Acidipila sp.]
MTYDEAVRILLSLGRELAAPRQARVQKFDLQNITLLARRLGSPHRASPCAHIAGTNGKGSTAAFLESILRAAGFKTGLYTSPHLVRINERIRVNGEEISDEDFAAAFTRVHDLIEELLASGALAAHPTFFECVTAMAFEHFARLHVEFAVYEVGLGGRLDSTNIIEPVLTIITPIDFDHEDYLGHSLELIAGEKAGIIKPGALVVGAAQPTEVAAVIRKIAKEKNARLVLIARDYRSEILVASPGNSRAVFTKLGSDWRLEVELPLAGRFQVQNALTAAVAARLLGELGFRMSDAAIARGIAGTRWPGRLQQVSERTSVFIDGTHNPAGARELVAFWREQFSGRRIYLVYGAMRDKAVDEIAGLLFPEVEAVIATAPRQSRAISAEVLAEMTGHHARQIDVVPIAEVALERAMELAGADDVVFATGSLYLAGDLLRYWPTRGVKLAGAVPAPAAAAVRRDS